jgi:hypothetical protein
MKLQNRIDLLQQLKGYLIEDSEEWQAVKARATAVNGWFTPYFINLSVTNIIEQFLQPDVLDIFIKQYQIKDEIDSKNVGIVMAGNIPLVGFHDFLCVFLSGHQQTIKLSSKDDVLLKHLIQKLYSWEVTVQNYISIASMLKGCDAYIATGGNNSAAYFDYYFKKFPHIIRRNRTSVAILTGKEISEELVNLADDVHLYFGLGCRNVTKIFVPENYDFVPLLQAFDKYKYFADHHKYKNNFDYYLTIQIMNNQYYMTNNSIILLKSEALFSPISQLNYDFYADIDKLTDELQNNTSIQCVVGLKIPFGKAQTPSIFDFADGVDTMQFLLHL